MASILIVDDEPVNRLLVKTILEYAGHQVAEAEDAAQAMHEAGGNVPDLAIIDLHLPGTGGAELVQALRRDPKTSAMKIALYTGSTVDAAMRDFMTVNRIEHVIPKPCEPQDLIEAVAEILSS